MRRIVSFLLLASVTWGADAIYTNGSVITVDPSKPYANAFAVTNGRFTAVGGTAEIRRLATPATKIVDLKGMTVTPGFNDAHLHVYDEDSPYYTPWLGPEKIHNMDELIATLKAKAAKTPPGQMVAGTRYQDSKPGRHPNCHDLDKASTEHPIRISQVGAADTAQPQMLGYGHLASWRRSWSITKCWGVKFLEKFGFAGGRRTLG